jgi:hypothetical protein
MTHTHITGPWSIFADEHSACELHIGSKTLPYVATVFDSEPGHITARQLATAQLIARAPDMLAALREIVRLIESPNDTRADILAVCDRVLGGL